MKYGTPLFGPPEQGTGPIGESADAWAVGVILSQLNGGTTEKQHKNFVEVYHVRIELGEDSCLGAENYYYCFSRPIHTCAQA